MKSVFKFVIASSVVLSGAFAQASLLKLEKGTRSIEGVNISKNAEASLDKEKAVLGTVGGGLRWKKVLLMKVKVYVAQLMVTSPERFVKKDQEALKSLDDSENVAIRMTFLRTVDAATVQTSFRDALSVNKVDMSSGAVKAFLDAVSKGGDASSGNSLTVLTHKNSDGTETLIYEDSNGKQTTINGEKGLTQSIFAMWLGRSADDGVVSLKSDLLAN